MRIYVDTHSFHYRYLLNQWLILIRFELAKSGDTIVNHNDLRCDDDNPFDVAIDTQRFLYRYRSYRRFIVGKFREEQAKRNDEHHLEAIHCEGQ